MRSMQELKEMIENDKEESMQLDELDYGEKTDT